MDRNHRQILCVVISVIASAVTTKELTTDYIDLLDFLHGDEFRLDNLHKKELSNTESFHFNASQPSHGAMHSLRKRQAPQGGGSTLLENKDFGACRTPAGEVGHCRHIIYCRLPELKNDIWKIVSQLCVIQGSTIGICCPDDTSTNVGIQIVTNNNDNARLGNYPEQRGCGIVTKQFPRVVGGRAAEPDEWPWMAAILRQDAPYVWCGGVLVSDQLVMTAAHCVYGEDKNTLFIRLGEYNTHVFNETRARDFRIRAMVTHVDYNPQTYENDIALVRVDRPTLFNTYIWPVCLPPVGENWEGYAGVVTGWGAKLFSGPHSDILMEVLLPVWNHEECKNAFIERISDSMVCAGTKTGGQDSCQGDSGGPFLVQLSNNRWVVAGIVSWGIGCGLSNRPGVYTRVDKYLQWIIENSSI